MTELAALEDAIRRACGFVEREGTAIDRVRLGCLLGETPASALAQALAPLRRPDGGFARPPDAPASVPSTRAGTARVLAWLAELRQLRGAVAEDAARFLARAQRPDGSWADDGAPVAPEDPFDFTALVAGLLTRVPSSPQRTLDAAARALGAAWTPDRVQGGRIEAIAGFACFYACAADERSDEVLQWCGRELERGFRTGALSALQVAGVLRACDTLGLPGAALEVHEIVSALLAAQADDGGFAPRAPAPARATATVDALASLRALVPAMLDPSKEVP